MVLIKCPECGKEVSNKADHCPFCGYSIVKNIMKQQLVETLSLRLIAVIIFWIVVDITIQRQDTTAVYFYFNLICFGMVIALIRNIYANLH
jgi:DNA-directed RNA polymerase subunit RPC12/RpoP